MPSRERLEIVSSRRKQPEIAVKTKVKELAIGTARDKSAETKVR